jgi:hypothetical protein
MKIRPNAPLLPLISSPRRSREPAVAYLVEQAEKFRNLKVLVAEGLADVEAGRVSEWNFEDFLRKARATRGH